MRATSRLFNLTATMSVAVAALLSSCKDDLSEVAEQQAGSKSARVAATVTVGTCTDNSDGTPRNTLITTNTTWTSGNVYVLRGYVRVLSGVTLTIQAGTRIQGECEGTLIIERGGRIDARGTASAPIVFTSNKATGKRPGDWGGVIILGDAPNNQGTNVRIEGIAFPSGTTLGFYGGTDAADNSGFFRYVRIEYPGTQIAEGNEINGLTLGSVGRGTTIDHVQVLYSQDDAFEWFGGNVDARYLYAYGTSDDDFDTDFGFTGRIQYAAGVKVSANVEASAGASNGFESDNDAAGSANTPLTDPRFAQVTLLGQCGTDAAGFGQGLLLRRNTRLDLFNSVIREWTRAINFTGATPEFQAVSVVGGGSILPSTPAGVGTASTVTFPCPISSDGSIKPSANIANTVNPNRSGETFFTNPGFRGAFSATTSQNGGWDLSSESSSFTWLRFPSFGN